MRWVLALWCVFLLALGARAKGGFRVVVRDLWTQRPLPRATLVMKAAKGEEDDIQFTANAEGVIDAPSGLRVGERDCTVRGLIEGVAYRQERVKILVQDDEVTELEIFLVPMKPVIFSPCCKKAPKTVGDVHFTVVDAVTKRPLEGAVVIIESDDSLGDGELYERRTVDRANALGRAWFGHEAGTYRYAVVGFVNGTFYKRQYGEVTILAGKDEQRTIELQPLGG